MKQLPKESPTSGYPAEALKDFLSRLGHEEDSLLLHDWAEEVLASLSDLESAIQLDLKTFQTIFVSAINGDIKSQPSTLEELFKHIGLLSQANESNAVVAHLLLKKYQDVSAKLSQGLEAEDHEQALRIFLTTFLKVFAEKNEKPPAEKKEIKKAVVANDADVELQVNGLTIFTDKTIEYRGLRHQLTKTEFKLLLVLAYLKDIKVVFDDLYDYLAMPNTRTIEYKRSILVRLWIDLRNKFSTLKIASNALVLYPDGTVSLKKKLIRNSVKKSKKKSKKNTDLEDDIIEDED